MLNSLSISQTRVEKINRPPARAPSTSLPPDHQCKTPTPRPSIPRPAATINSNFWSFQSKNIFFPTMTGIVCIIEWQMLLLYFEFCWVYLCIILVGKRERNVQQIVKSCRIQSKYWLFPPIFKYGWLILLLLTSSLCLPPSSLHSLNCSLYSSQVIFFSASICSLSPNWRRHSSLWQINVLLTWWRNQERGGDAAKMWARGRAAATGTVPRAGCTEQLVQIQTQIHKHNYTNTNKQTQIHNYTNTQTQLHKHNYTNTNTK